MMKRFRFITIIGMMFFIILGIVGCNPVEKVFDKDWTSMSKEDKIALENYFKKQGYDDPQDYWDLCADEGADTAGRINPWAISVKSKPVKVKVYIDNSSSMEGYFNSPNSSPIIEVISGVQQFFGKMDNNIQGYYVDKQNNFANYSLDSLTADLTKKKLRNYQDSYQLDQLIGRMVSDIKKDNKNKTISFLITDGIPSGSNEEINHSINRSFNKQSASALQYRIASKFYGTNNIAVSVYQFMSGFNGKYWYYNNDRKPMNLSNKPFYIIAVGDRELVSELAEKEAEGLQMFKSNNKVHFGGVDKTKIKFSHQDVSPDQFDGEDKIHIISNISLAGLPYFARNDKFLEKNCTLKINGQEWKYGKWKVATGGNIEIPMDVEIENTYKIYIHITNTTPSWVDTFTCLDDKKEGVDLGKETFNFKYLVEGLKNGVTGSKGDVTLYEHEFEFNTNEEN